MHLLRVTNCQKGFSWGTLFLFFIKYGKVSYIIYNIYEFSKMKKLHKFFPLSRSPDSAYREALQMMSAHSTKSSKYVVMKGFRELSRYIPTAAATSLEPSRAHQASFNKPR